MSVKQQIRATHQQLIKEIKISLNLPKLQSSFISRSNILQYINKIHSQNVAMRFAIDPPSVNKQLELLEAECQALRVQLNVKENQEKYMRRLIDKIDDEIYFVEEQVLKNRKQCQDLRKELQQFEEESLIPSRGGEDDQVSSLMSKMMNYFENHDQEASRQSESELKNFEGLNEGLNFLDKILNKNQGRSVMLKQFKANSSQSKHNESGHKQESSGNSQVNQELKKILHLDMSQEKLKREMQMRANIL